MSILNLKYIKNKTTLVLYKQKTFVYLLKNRNYGILQNKKLRNVNNKG
jgi:hypothetical protein